jgi:hypothetical protein
MSAKEKDLEIEDDLAKGPYLDVCYSVVLIVCSPKDLKRAQGQDIVPIQEEFRVGEGCEVFGFENCALDSE